MNKSLLAQIAVLFVLLGSLVWAASDPPIAVEYGPPMFGDFTTRTPDAIPLMQGALKIAENESPVPQNRAFFNYNYYDNVQGFHANQHRQMIGFEKSFADGRASLGLRQAFYQYSGSLSGSGVDDLNVIIKYAPILHHDAGRALSTGLVLTVPSSSKGLQQLVIIEPTDRSEGTPTHFYLEQFHSTQFQPFIGYHWSQRNLFLQGFSSIVIPTKSQALKVLLGLQQNLWVTFGSGN